MPASLRISNRPNFAGSFRGGPDRARSAGSPASFVTELWPPPGDASFRECVSLITVLEDHVAAIELMQERLQVVLTLDRVWNGVSVPEVPRRMELPSRMLEQLLKLEQQVGIRPDGVYSRLKGMPLGENDLGDNLGFQTFVESMVKTPADELG